MHSSIILCCFKIIIIFINLIYNNFFDVVQIKFL
nr:MAG TPA: hypothetical protein [Caudoviricetes sp.]